LNFFYFCIREQVEINQITDVKKEKINETKHKSSINPSQMSDELNTPVRSLAVNSKEMPQKVRRATTDSGQPKVSIIKITIIIKYKYKIFSLPNINSKHRQNHHHYKDKNQNNIVHILFHLNLFHHQLFPKKKMNHLSYVKINFKS
jgi:hypothetical protein